MYAQWEDEPTDPYLTMGESSYSKYTSDEFNVSFTYGNIENENVGDIVFDYQELISPHIMSVDRFNNAKDYSFLTNVLEDGVVLV